METIARILEPRAPHIDTLKNGNQTIMSEDGTRLVCWCPRHRCGAIWNIEARFWTMQQPVDFAEFLQGLRNANIQLPEGADLAQWIDACTGTAAGPAGSC